LSTIKKFAGQTAVYGLSTIISRSLYFILTPILVHALSPKIYGVFTKMYSWASLVSAILSFGMETTFFRYLNKREDNKDKVYSNSFITVAAAALLFFLLTFFSAEGIATWLNGGTDKNTADYIFYVKCFIYILILDALCVIPFAKVRADGRPFRYSIIKFSNIVLVFILNLFFLFGAPYLIKHHLAGADWIATWYRPLWVGYVFLANLIASFVTLIMLLPEILKLKLRFDFKMFGEMVLYSWPILVANISFIINENLDKIMLDKLLPPSISNQEIGIYSACAKIALFLSLFVQAFRLGAEPFFFSHAKNKNSGETYSRIMTYFIIVVALIAVALTANIELLKYFVRGGTPELQKLYWSGLQVVPILLFGYVSLGIYMNLSIWYKLSDQTRFGLYISGIGAILTIILNLIFIPKYSYIASAWISLIAYATMMVLSYILGQKNYPIPYQLKKNVAYLIASAVIVYLSFTVFHRNLIVGNLFLILFMAASLYSERKELLLLLKNDHPNHQ